MKSRHCRVCGEFHDLNSAWPTSCNAHFATRGPRSALTAPMIVRDGMDPIQSMADGQIYDSKSRYYDSVRAHGCEIVGNEKAAFDKQPTYEPQGVRDSMKQAIEQLEAGHVRAA